MRLPRLFIATATLMVDNSERIATQWDERDTSENAREMTMATRLQQLRGLELQKQTIASLTKEERDLILSTSPESLTRADKDLALTEIVRSAVTFGRVPETMLISISAVHRNAAVTALLANRFAERAAPYMSTRNNASTAASLTFLRDQAEDVRKKVEEAERQLQEYRQKYNLVSLEANQNIIVDNLKSLNASATAARVARVAIEARLEQAEVVMKRGGDAAQLAPITGFAGLADVAARLSELQGKRAVLAERYGRRHPLMQENQRAIEAVEKLRDEQAATALSNLRDQRARALAEERQLAEQRTSAEKAALELDRLGVEYNILRRTVESHKETYTVLLNRLNNATISGQLRGVNMKISQLAYTPEEPFMPNVRRTIMLSVTLAIVILLGYPFSAEMFFGRIRSAGDVEVHLDATVLGEVGSVRRVLEKDRPTLVHSEKDETVVEQFRALYSQLTLTSKIDPPKAILVTSTVPGEGKSFVAANLAECFVAHNRRTLLIDADLRRPAQHRQFGLDNKAGILRWLEEGGALEGDILRDPKLGIVEIFSGMYLLRAGGSSRRATELVDGDRLVSLLTTLQRHFDIMILDTPPAGVFPDAVAFGRVCQEFIYICRFNTPSRQAVRDVLERLRQTGLEFPGVVLNAMPTGLGGSYYYKGYGYHHAKTYAKHYGPAKE